MSFQTETIELVNNTTSDFIDAVEDSYRKSKFIGKPRWAEVGYYAIPSLGIPGNILTIGILMSNPVLRRKPVNMFIIHQSVIDLIVCILTIAEELIIKYGINGQAICHLFLTKIVSSIAMYTSSYNMTALTLERHFAIIDPLHYDLENVRKRLPYVFTFVWMFCIVALGVIPVSTIYKNAICYTAIKLKGIIHIILLIYIESPVVTQYRFVNMLSL